MTHPLLKLKWLLGQPWAITGASTLYSLFLSSLHLFQTILCTLCHYFVQEDSLAYRITLKHINWIQDLLRCSVPALSVPIPKKSRCSYFLWNFFQFLLIANWSHFHCLRPDNSWISREVFTDEEHHPGKLFQSLGLLWLWFSLPQSHIINL